MSKALSFKNVASLPASGFVGQPLVLTSDGHLYTWSGSVWVDNGATGSGGVTDGDKGDITVTASGATWTIDPGVVTLAKMASVATARILGRTTAATGVPEALTGTQATALLDVVTSVAKGLAPASGGGTTTFLRADGTWAAAGGGSLYDVQVRLFYAP